MRSHKSSGLVRATAALVITTAFFSGGNLAVRLEAADEQSSHRLLGSKATDQARRTVEHLGVGAHVELTLDWGERIRGSVQEIGDDFFTVILDGSGARADVRYADVRQLGPIVLRPIQQRRLRPESTAYNVAGVALIIGALVFMAVASNP